MKNKIIGITCVLMLLISASSYAQTIIDTKKETEKQGVKRANKKIEKGIDAGFDKLEDGIGSLFGKKKKKKKAVEKAVVAKDPVAERKVNTPAGDESAEVEAKVGANVQWSKFDFVPGDEVIFEDGPSEMEESGEFPSRWDLVTGQVEIATVNNEPVMMFIDGSAEIIPYLENSDEDYLPEVFTVEYDFYRPAFGNRFSLYLNDRKNQKSNGGQEIEINYSSISVDSENITSSHPEKAADNSWNSKGHWIHVSLAYTKGKLKVYMDENRLINIPRYSKNPSGISLQAYWADMSKDKAFYVKNVRIAKGGVKYYDRILSDGKIICNGIRFETNKASLKRESMGPINKIFQLMQKQADLKFSVEGHTDSDGDDANNLTLSEDRAKTVMHKLIEMGIAVDRLKSKGFGESKALDNNTTPEGKANNRRVEFVKI